MIKKLTLTLALGTLFNSHQIVAVEIKEKNDEAEETITILGSRRSDRTVIESSVPIDLISAEDIARSGVTQTIELLQTLVPSFNAQKNSITDATDYVRPAQLRGLGPEHVLVLVNGKRRHTSSVVHDNEQARGSVSVDLNSIPPSSIQSIQVLRDGAAAQYGSDAIAGVININLKKSSKFEMGLTIGQNYSKEDRGYEAGSSLNGTNTDASLGGGNTYFDWTNTTYDKTHTDGKNVIFNIAKGVELENGFIHGSIQYWQQGKADRAGLDPNYQYFATDPDGNPSFDRDNFNDPDAGLTTDPREDSFDRENWWFGKSEMEDISAMVNSEFNLNGYHSAYAFGGISRRKGKGPCFWREPGSTNNVRSIHPDGYLPNVEPINKDISMVAGVKGDVGEYSYDASIHYGSNDFNFKGSTLNTSLGSQSPTFFDGGGTKFDQFSANFDVVTSFDLDLASDLNVAFGAEYRVENYEIYAGESDAFRNGGVPITDGPYGDGMGGGRTAVVGTQCVQAFHAVDQVDEDRTNYAAYLDLEADIVENFTLGFAGRYEDYSDFGSNFSGKFSGRWAVSDNVALRGAYSTGFRAPALQQQYYSNRSLQSNADGSLSQTGTFPVNTSVAQALGAEPLEAEKSTSLSLGLTYNVANLSLSIDAYKVEVDDRILLSEQFDGRLDPSGFSSFLDSMAVNDDFLGIKKVNYFINGLDTTTQGIDIIGKYTTDWVSEGELSLTTAINFTDTDIDKLADTPSELSPYTDQTILGHTNTSNIENATPESMLHFTINYQKDLFSAFWKTIRYGSLVAAERFAGNNPINDQRYNAQLISNAEVAYIFMDSKMTAALGANNIFDTYPDKRYKAQSRKGILPYSGYVPYGFTGRYLYLRFNYSY